MATGTCSFTNRKPPTSASITTSRVVRASACTLGGTRCPRTRSTTYWKFSAVSRLGPPGRPMLVLLYVPLTHFYFSFPRNMPIISDRECIFFLFLFSPYISTISNTHTIESSSNGLITIFDNFYSLRLRKR